LTTLLIAFAFLLAVALVWWGIRSRGTPASPSHGGDNIDTLTGWPPQATRVLTTAERQAYDLLRAAFPVHMILAQVPLQRFIKVPTRYSYSEWLRRVGQINADMVICDRHSQVIAVVEIQAEDDEPGGRARRRRERMMRVLESAQIPVHLWRASSLPTVEGARHAILPLQPEEEARAEPATAAVHSLPGRLSPAKASPPAEEVMPMREPPPSTWFDDLDSAPAPLAGEPPKEGLGSKPRPPGR
jgi:hypothetical protein